MTDEAVEAQLKMLMDYAKKDFASDMEKRLAALGWELRKKEG